MALVLPGLIALSQALTANATSIKATHIVTGSNFSCTVVGGLVKCWGSNITGQLGDKTPGDVSQGPVTVKGLSNVSVLAAGFSHACAVASGSTWCWGANHMGQLGDGTNDHTKVPVKVSGLPGVPTALAAGATHTCAIVNQEVYCWGESKLLGQAEPPSGRRYLGPSKVASLTQGAVAVSAGSRHTCASINGAVWCWGENDRGQLGTGDTVEQLLPVQARDFVRVTSITSSGNRTCGIANSELSCWGENSTGILLGLENKEDILIPTRVVAINQRVSGVSIGERHMCVLTAEGAGQVICWGDNDKGQLARTWWRTLLLLINHLITGRGTHEKPAVTEELPGGVVAIAGASNHNCVILLDGTPRCWGENGHGELSVAPKSFLMFGRGTSFSSIPMASASLR